MANTFNRGDVVETPVGNGVVQRKRQHFEQYEVLLDAPVIEKFLHESDYRYPNDKSQPRVVGWAEGNQGAFHPSLLKKVEGDLGQIIREVDEEEKAQAIKASGQE
ncbi:unnamed protein product [Didymodactylos carnosus]|uniref:Uncharacterized protein n=1 Tax=Didymodactylos carnosus TaxID=1234261 RepID=A0A815MZY5_9BILA|nr:unnamed protein product [Didymodactylos carnosus]CAF4309252.1 unnamed protein product [Didymodactylos carnosus]